VTGYSTPLSTTPLPLDESVIQQLKDLTTDVNHRTLRFTTMSQSADEAEHSCEMQLPYIHRLIQTMQPKLAEADYPRLVPIMVGNTNQATEAAFGKLLAPYVADPENAFVLSSDFCHWGSRFGYTYYLPSAPSPALSPLNLPNGAAAAVGDATSMDLQADTNLDQGIHLVSKNTPKTGQPAVHESIAHTDRACMCAIATGQHSAFLKTLSDTGNTVCGRHPIGVFMAAWEEVQQGKTEADRKADASSGKGRFRFVRYERSSDVESARDSSVSYISGFAVL
jgi:MEMO1 family protein